MKKPRRAVAVRRASTPRPAPTSGSAGSLRQSMPQARNPETAQKGLSTGFPRSPRCRERQADGRPERPKKPNRWKTTRPNPTNRPRTQTNRTSKRRINAETVQSFSAFFSGFRLGARMAHIPTTASGRVIFGPVWRMPRNPGSTDDRRQRSIKCYASTGEEAEARPGSRRWGSATSGGCPSPERSQLSDGHFGSEPTILGWRR